MGLMSLPAITLGDVQAAADRIRPHARRTPVHTCAALDSRAGRRLFFKCELFQKTGAFKFRGACNAVMKLEEREASRGVVTQSSGNHGQALALAAQLRGVPAHVVMPHNTARAKVDGVRHYGARLIFCDPTLASREETAARIVRETGGIYVPPYNHRDVIAGQGTLALELLEQVPGLDAIIAPVGGGGLISGICVVARGCRPGLRVFAAEPAGADDAFRSKQAGELIPQTAPRTIADGLQTSLGDLTWPFVRDVVERVLPVPEEHIGTAMRTMWQFAKLLIEPSSAVAVAAVLGPDARAFGDAERVGVVLSGGNADLDHLPW